MTPRPLASARAAESAAETSSAAWDALKAAEDAAWLHFVTVVTAHVRAVGTGADQYGRDTLAMLADAGDAYRAAVNMARRPYMTAARAANRARGLHHP
jgi:hypothetical protein